MSLKPPFQNLNVFFKNESLELELKKEIDLKVKLLKVFVKRFEIENFLLYPLFSIHLVDSGLPNRWNFKLVCEKWVTCPLWQVSYDRIICGGVIYGHVSCGRVICSQG